MTARSPEAHTVDAWWTVLVIDPVAIRLVRMAHGVAMVTPMRLTAIAHLVGLVTAALFATGHLVPGAIVYELRFILDCMDGKLARRRQTTTALGAYFDFVGDYVITALNFGALGIWLHWDAGTSPLLAFAPAVIFLCHMCIRLSTESLGTMPRVQDAIPGRYSAWMAQRRLVPIPGRVDVEHAYLFLVPMTAAISGVESLLVGATAAVAAYFLYVGVRFFHGGITLANTIDRTGPDPEA